MSDIFIRHLSNRLDHLERQNRRLKKGLFAICGAISIVLIVGAAIPAPVQNQGDGSFETLRARKIVISDNDGKERLILELDAGEPTLKMYNHSDQRQIFLGIDELWEDTAYLSLASRLENGNVDKQAVLAVTPTRPTSAGNSQLVLYDTNAQQEAAAVRQIVRLSSGLVDQKPFLELRNASSAVDEQVSLELLEAKPSGGAGGVLLDLNSEPARLSGVQIAR